MSVYEEVDLAIVEIYTWIRSYLDITNHMINLDAEKITQLIIELFKTKVDKKKIAVSLHTQILLQKKNLALDQEAIKIWH